ncbi:hypothetical protein NPS70_01860 [Streptomyces sp. C10-9-1]|uniref:hypothetical protein n=1 Tax=Streptomyces sp. C10-9-1 TaxID=1859285 RepID=UPI0021130E31|nr:hypothetical protein [Streptomyces sp. C10-9-1]MCQ6551953.1 hypothetical protein [Streptomyces sp. C10-9-1]
MGTRRGKAAADDARSDRVLVVTVDLRDRAHPGPAAARAGLADRCLGAGASLAAYRDRVFRGRVVRVPAVPEKARPGPADLAATGGDAITTALLVTAGPALPALGAVAVGRGRVRH